MQPVTDASLPPRRFTAPAREAILLLIRESVRLRQMDAAPARGKETGCPAPETDTGAAAQGLPSAAGKEEEDHAKDPLG